MSERDEVVVVPEAPAGGFMCPCCLFTTTSKKLAEKMHYCPECGQHVRISTKEFDALKKLTNDLTYEQREKCCKFCAIIGPDASHEKRIAGIQKKKLENLWDELAPIKGQMNLKDFMKV